MHENESDVWELCRSPIKKQTIDRSSRVDIELDDSRLPRQIAATHRPGRMNEDDGVSAIYPLRPEKRRVSNSNSLPFPSHKREGTCGDGHRYGRRRLRSSEPPSGPIARPRSWTSEIHDERRDS